MRTSLGLLALVLVLTLAIWLGVGCSPTTNHTSASLGRFAYVGFEKGGSGRYIVTMNEDGTGEIEFSGYFSVGSHSQFWSRNGKLVYLEDVSNDSTIWLSIVDADGGNQRRLLNVTDLNISSLSISPDGMTVLLTYQSRYSIEVPHEGHTDIQTTYVANIYAVDVATGVMKPLTDFTDIKAEEPAFSPDSCKIAFIGRTIDPQTHYDIYVMNGDGSNLRKLTQNNDLLNFFEAPQWSPDGRKILYGLETLCIDDITHYDDIFVLDVSSGESTNLTNSTGTDDIEFRWSPDGKRIAFVSGNGTNGYATYVMDADGSNIVKVGDYISQPSWVPDGQHLVAAGRTYDEAAGRWVSTGIVTVDLKSGNVKSLAQTGDKYSVMYYPVWLSW